MSDKCQLMDQVCKFKIGDTVQMAVCADVPVWRRHFMQVMERIVNQCEGGVQVQYDCRMHFVEGDRYAPGGERRKVHNFMAGEVGNGYHRFKESELIPFVVSEGVSALDSELDAE